MVDVLRRVRGLIAGRASGTAGSSLTVAVTVMMTVMMTVTTGLVAGCAGGGASSGAQQAAPVVAGPPGKTVFAQSCARCHGYRGEPLRSGTPALTPAKIAGQGDQVLALLVRSGKGDMPAFGALTDQQVADLIAYLRSIT